jgi:hypothetical protein
MIDLDLEAAARMAERIDAAVRRIVERRAARCGDKGAAAVEAIIAQNVLAQMRMRNVPESERTKLALAGQAVEALCKVRA